VALSEDQKAILRLLAQRGAQGYDDLAALMGISVDEVHSRARQAAENLEAEGIPAPSIPVPEGAEGGSSGGDRIEEPPAEDPPSAKPEPPAPRKEEVAPTPSPPPALPKGPPKPPLWKEVKLLENRGLWAILAGVAIVVIFLVVLLVGNGGSDSSSTTTGGESSAAAAEEVAAKEGKKVTKAVLNPVDGSEAKGVAVFGRVKKSLALQVLAEGLEQTGSADSYTIWLAASPQRMLPLASTEVKADGRIRAQVEVPVEVLAYLANETFGQIAITKTDDSQLKASLAQATKNKKAPVYTGTEVLRGTVTGPIVGAAKESESE
jgi:hypothetical protein